MRGFGDIQTLFLEIFGQIFRRFNLRIEERSIQPSLLRRGLFRYGFSCCCCCWPWAWGEGKTAARRECREGETEKRGSRPFPLPIVPRAPYIIQKFPIRSLCGGESIQPTNYGQSLVFLSIRRASSCVTHARSPSRLRKIRKFSRSIPARRAPLFFSNTAATATRQSFSIFQDEVSLYRLYFSSF